MSTKYSAVLFSGGLDSAVLLAHALAARGPGEVTVALHVGVGFAWEAEERAMMARLLAQAPFAGTTPAPVELDFNMRDVFPATHWAVRGEPPAFDTPDEEVFIDGRNVILLSKAAVYAAKTAARGSSITLSLGTLACNPFPDATPAFFDAMSRALSLGLDAAIAIEAPFAQGHKADVIRRGVELGVPLELTLSCMQPKDGRHCGRCSKCRERRDAFREAGVADPTSYRHTPIR
ncbi:MAG TPA: 7-cyano-7-deazaguanine synthase [Vicinamibacterales bacterium]|nr:7-cyano-7-deazaguanine synthase [Vicinamibacterales bacterium]